MRESFSIDELVSALYGADEGGDGWHTVRELGELWGMSTDKTREILRRAQRAGYAVEVRHVRRRSIDGRSVPVPAYRITRERDDGKQ